MDEAFIERLAETPATLAAREDGVAGSATRGDALPRSLVDSDDSSYPPVDIDNHFFGGNEQLRLSEPLPLEAEERDPRMALKRTPEVARRRANLQKYVKVAVAAASALCLAALVKVAVVRSASDHERQDPVRVAAAPPSPTQNAVPTAAESVVVPVVAAAPPVAAPAVVVAPSASVTPPVAVGDAPPAEASASAAPPVPAPADTAPPTAEAPADSAAAAAAAPAELDPKAAAKEKNACQNALERGKVTDAIEAGERSVVLDPTDGEAWLILGAAYQQKGDMKNARRSYRACLEQGKRGPKYECAAMPH
jgi:tetratricopeptide (TPR) repeat protein